MDITEELVRNAESWTPPNQNPHLTGSPGECVHIQVREVLRHHGQPVLPPGKVASTVRRMKQTCTSCSCCHWGRRQRGQEEDMEGRVTVMRDVHLNLGALRENL